MGNRMMTETLRSSSSLGQMIYICCSLLSDTGKGNHMSICGLSYDPIELNNWRFENNFLLIKVLKQKYKQFHFGHTKTILLFKGLAFHHLSRSH